MADRRGHRGNAEDTGRGQKGPVYTGLAQSERQAGADRRSVAPSGDRQSCPARQEGIRGPKSEMGRRHAEAYAARADGIESRLVSIDEMETRPPNSQSVLERILCQEARLLGPAGRRRRLACGQGTTAL